jgi:hypothetical protein
VAHLCGSSKVEKIVTAGDEMNNPELEKLLKSVETPRRSDDYWTEFPGKVVASLNRAGQSTARTDVTSNGNLRLLIGWGLGLATACVVIGFSIGFWRGRESGLKLSELEIATKYYREIELMFPNQVQAIVFDREGPRLVLAEKANVPRSTPYYLKICSGTGCQELVTFSGQQILFNGEKYEVLADGKGKILLLGNGRVLAETDPSASIRVQAQAIGTSP